MFCFRWIWRGVFFFSKLITILLHNINTFDQNHQSIINNNVIKNGCTLKTGSLWIVILSCDSYQEYYLFSHYVFSSISTTCPIFQVFFKVVSKTLYRAFTVHCTDTIRHWSKSLYELIKVLLYWSIQSKAPDPSMSSRISNSLLALAFP